MYKSPLCTPVCPFRAFYCTKKALVIRKRGNSREAWCAWIGDKCIGYKCKFASCTRHALLPDGRCKLMLRKEEKKEIPLEEEVAKAEREMTYIRRKLRKIGIDLERLE